MAAAHLAVERHDGDIEKYQKELKKGKSLQEKNASTVKYKRQKALIDGAYTELKRAQEATLKSIKIKRQQMEIRLSARTHDSEAEPEEALSPEVKRKKNLDYRTASSIIYIANCIYSKGHRVPYEINLKGSLKPRRQR